MPELEGIPRWSVGDAQSIKDRKTHQHRSQESPQLWPPLGHSSIFPHVWNFFRSTIGMVKILSHDGALIPRS
ncbi:hypothetical protein EDB19DRAFT_2026558 [Suillus lakei]|nr:hypothetical protein EDB19DRAFT_2026558 [Suillus lakei]